MPDRSCLHRRTRAIVISFAAALLLFAAASVHAAVPSTFTYQGSLKQNGTPVNSTVSMQFKLTNATGSQVYWTSGAQNVQVQEGLYRVELSPTGINWSQVEPYIEVTVQGNTLLPREKLTSSAYALVAKELEGGVASLAAITGEVRLWSTSTPPNGWHLCNGSAISRTTYAALFAVIGTSFGAGDGSTTFQLPDFRGRMPIGAGTGPGLTARSLAEKGGAETHAHAIPHRHGTPIVRGPSGHVLVPATSGGWGQGTVSSHQTYSSMQPAGGSTSTESWYKTMDTDTPNSSGSNGMPPFFGIYFIIKN